MMTLFYKLYFPLFFVWKTTLWYSILVEYYIFFVLFLSGWTFAAEAVTGAAKANVYTVTLTLDCLQFLLCKF